VKEGAIREGTPGYTIMGLGKAPQPENGAIPLETNGGQPEKDKIEVVFDEKLGADHGGKKLVRYQLNPRENWGPMNRAKGAI
jgi:tRNA (guanine26-N2/guanine27-N2)-dimethyltransferase